MYSTDNPRFATMGAVLIVIITSFIFFVYDLAVRREFIAKQQLLQAKRHFMRFVSHEVRTPLNAVCLGLSLLQDEIRQTFDHNKNEDSHNKQTPLFSTPIDNKLEKLETHMQEWLVLTQEICDSAESSVAVLNDLLNYDKIQMGNFTLELTVFPILSLIQHVFKEFRLSAKKKSIAFELNCDHLLGPSQCLLDVEDGGVLANVNDFQVVGDTIRLTQVLRNLVSNALKFTPEGGKNKHSLLGQFGVCCSCLIPSFICLQANC